MNKLAENESIEYTNRNERERRVEHIKKRPGSCLFAIVVCTYVMLKRHFSLSVRYHGHVLTSICVFDHERYTSIVSY